MPMVAATRERHHLNAILSEATSVPSLKDPLFPPSEGSRLSYDVEGDMLEGSRGRSPSQQAKHTALSAIAAKENPFMFSGIAAIEELPTGEYTGEQVRMRLTQDSITPDHPNAWGSLITQAIRRGLLVETGRYVPMECLTSHGRKTQIYTHSRV